MTTNSGVDDDEGGCDGDDDEGKNDGKDKDGDKDDDNEEDDANYGNDDDGEGFGGDGDDVNIVSRMRWTRHSGVKNTSVAFSRLAEDHQFQFFVAFIYYLRSLLWSCDVTNYF